MGSNTTNYNLYKPDVGEQDWGAFVNVQSWDAIDAQMKVNADGVSTNVTAIGLNTTHRTSNGSDHSFIDQDVTSGAGVTFGSVLIDQDGNSTSLNIDSEATTATVVDIALANTSGNGISIVNTANHASSSLVNLNQQNALSAARVLYINNDGIGIGALISNDNASSSADVISVGNAGTGDGIFIDQNGNGTSLNIDSEATTANVVTINNAGTGYGEHIHQVGNGVGLYIQNAGTSFGSYIGQDAALAADKHALYVVTGIAQTTSPLVKFFSDNGGASANVLDIVNDGTGNGLFIDQNGNGVAVSIDNAGTQNGLLVTQNAVLAAGYHGLYVNSAAAHTNSDSALLKVTGNHTDSTEPIVEIIQEHSGSASYGLGIRSDGTGAHINLSGDPTVASPVDGDFWFDGTSLNMRVGAVTTDLLDAGASGTRATFDDGDLTAGVLTITHSLGLSTPFTLLLTIADNAQKQIIPDEVTFLTNTITVDLTSYGTLTGIYGYYYI